MIIKHSLADIKRAQTVEAAWYSFIIQREETKPSKDQQSTNIHFVCTFEDPAYEGKELPVRFNSKALGMMIPFEEAILNRKVTPNEEIDTSGFIGKKFDGKIAVEIYEGKPQNDYTAFLPYGKSREASPF